MHSWFVICVSVGGARGQGENKASGEATIELVDRPVNDRIELDPPRSLTHQHLLSVVNTEADRFPDSLVRLLDVGCGGGHLIAYLTRGLRRLRPGLRFEIHGLDVVDHGVQGEGFLSRTIQFLNGAEPMIDWERRLTGIQSSEKWPYDDECFDVIVSNQVGEHVRDHVHFWREIERTLRPGGFSAHLFPLRHCIIDGHLGLPFVHRIEDFDFLVSYIKLASRLGLGKFRGIRREAGISLEKYAESHADYMRALTNYITHREILRLLKRVGLRGSFRYTPEFYKLKLRQMMGLSSGNYLYSHDRACVADWVMSFCARYIASVTLFIEKKYTYSV